LYDKKKQALNKVHDTNTRLLDEFVQQHSYFLFLQSKPGEFFVLKKGTDSLIYLNIIKGQKTISHLPFVPGAEEFHYRSRLFAVSDTSFYLTGHNSGFYSLRFYPKTGKVKLDPYKYFPSYLCSAVLPDQEGQLWVGTNKGLFRQDVEKEWIQIAEVPQQLIKSYPNLRLSHIYASTDKVYAAALGEGGLLIFDKKNFSFQQQVLLDRKWAANNHVSSLVPVEASVLLVGTYGQLHLFNTITKVVSPVMPKGKDQLGWINDIYTDHAGSIWIAGAENVAKFNPANKAVKIISLQKDSLNLPVYFSEDKEQRMWMCSHGIARYDSTSGKFDRIVDSFPFIKMPDRQVSTFLFDGHDNLWFNSVNNGLIKYDKKRKSFRHFTNRDGLPDNNTLALLNVKDQLWIACLSGVACLDLKTERIYAFGVTNGFPDGQLTKGCRFFYDSTRRQIYLPYPNSLVRFNPGALLQQKPSPKTFIESVVIEGKETVYLPGASLQTLWKDKELRITIGSINFRDGAMQRYAYRVIEDSSTAWTEIGMQSSFSISN
ncbi:MAG TPA: hypothetical protein VEY06_08980, partial [Flavisolibacter sp.]|nr:hypothetical protein [Flavisolibacter sp.]